MIECCAMYSHTPLHPVADSPSLSSSVLSTFPSTSARSVVASVVTPVSAKLGLGHHPWKVEAASAQNGGQQSQQQQEGPALKTEAQIDWFMEVGRDPILLLLLLYLLLALYSGLSSIQVVCHGLSLPLSEHDIIKDCVNIYCEWLSALLPTPKSSVPKPVAQVSDIMESLFRVCRI